MVSVACKKVPLQNEHVSALVKLFTMTFKTKMIPARVNSMIEYRGYIGHFSFDEEKMMFFGKVANSHDFITFQGKSVSELKLNFRNSVEEYIAWCKRYRKEK